MLPQLGEPLPPITRIRIRTTKESISIVPIAAEIPEDYYPSIPSSLSLPRVSISQLQRLCQLSSPTVDLVTVDNEGAHERYAFKHSPSHWPSCATSAGHHSSLAELMQLVAIRSPFIAVPQSIVTDVTGKLYRGFLTSYMPAGSLTQVLDKLHPSKPIWSLKSAGLQPIALRPCVQETMGDSVTKLTWATKHTWSIEIARAITTLHETVSWGDVKLDNILLDRSGHIQLIDIAPVNGYTREYVAPELKRSVATEWNDMALPHSVARDIFALGLVLWQIGSEVAHFDREDVHTSPMLMWMEGKGESGGAVPNWFRNLVECCVCKDPRKRPSGTYILGILEEEFAKGLSGI